MTAKEYLSQAWTIDKRIEANLEEIQRLRTLAERITGTYRVTRSSSLDQRGRLERAITDIDELVSNIGADVNDLVSVKHDIRDTIRQVDRHEEQTLLQLRYLNGMKWEEIAVEMGYSWQWTHKIHKKALDSVKEAIKSDTIM
jgi:DNA-directed RNA polymerase specialized sigma subunit